MNDGTVRSTTSKTFPSLIFSLENPRNEVGNEPSLDVTHQSNYEAIFIFTLLFTLIR